MKAANYIKMVLFTHFIYFCSLVIKNSLQLCERKSANFFTLDHVNNRKSSRPIHGRGRYTEVNERQEEGGGEGTLRSMRDRRREEGKVH